MQGVHITNEIGHLKAVLVHRPGTETQNYPDATSAKFSPCENGAVVLTSTKQYMSTIPWFNCLRSMA